MKLNKNKSQILSKRATLLTLVTLGLILISLFIFFWVYKGSVFGWSPLYSKTDSIDYTAPTDEQKNANSNLKDNIVSGDTGESKNTASDKPAQPTPADTEGGKSKVGVVISAAEQLDSVVQIRAFVESIVNTGNCTVKITNTSTGRTFSTTAGVQPQSSFSSCRGFNIDVNNVGPGQWKIEVKYENDSLYGITEKIIEAT